MREGARSFDRSGGIFKIARIALRHSRIRAKRKMPWMTGFFFHRINYSVAAAAVASNENRPSFLQLLNAANAILLTSFGK